MNKPLLFLLALILILSGGCTMTPEYTRPEAPIPTDLPNWEEDENTQSTREVQVVADLKWREFFTDRKLQQIIEMALKNNLDLRLAALNVEKVRALYGVQKAELFPVISAVGGGSKQQSSGDLTAPGNPRTTQQYGVDLGITAWEIDFFGRIRSLEERALQEYLATKEARRGARIALISGVARTYLTLAADRENL
ncbi:MAG: TolC family protein, partial [Candidatus Auribacterota bacterium]|nr:TolC family protein [Candidatus Auribacterota bacterium]